MEERKIFIEMNPRYFEDTVVNGEADISYDEQYRVKARPRMPLTEWSESDREYVWKFELSEDGVIKGWPEGNTAETHYKVCDECGVRVEVNGILVLDYDGYVPRFLDPKGCEMGDFDGDYVRMDIDGEGRISPWYKEDLERFLREHLNIYLSD